MKTCKTFNACENNSKICYTVKTENAVTLSFLVRQYVLCCRSSASKELRFFADQESLKSTIKAAAIASYQGKRHPHQRRISKQALKVAAIRLLIKVRALRACRSFQHLLDIVEHTTHEINGLGALYSYDTAHRIGAKLGLSPVKVYLHSGTRIGARNLGLSYRQESLELNDLPYELRSLAPCEIEDFLCIYKNMLAKLSR